MWLGALCLCRLEFGLKKILTVVVLALAVAHAAYQPVAEPVAAEPAGTALIVNI